MKVGGKLEIEKSYMGEMPMHLNETVLVINYFWQELDFSGATTQPIFKGQESLPLHIA
jgi:hypothetical protein